MLASLYWEVVDRLQSYLIGVESLDEFEDWLVSRSWDVHRTEDQPAIHLVSEIELRLAEFTSGHWTEEELRKFFLEKVFGAVYREIRR